MNAKIELTYVLTTNHRSMSSYKYSSDMHILAMPSCLTNFVYIASRENL